MATIEFTTSGEIITANDNFLQVIGYPLSEIVGKHHKIFCTDEFYQVNPNFWEQLAIGEVKFGKYERRNASDITANEERNRAVIQAAELSFSTAEETAQIANNSAELPTNLLKIPISRAGDGNK